MSKVKSAPKARPAFEKPSGLSIQDKLILIQEDMTASLIEREEEIKLLLTALLAGEHPLFVGKPGTAKSLMLDSLMRALSNGNKFNILFTKFTTPEEVFGPISVAGLKSDVYRRITKGMLPEADFAFGDEIFKASSAILNTLLRIINERQFANGDGTFKQCPLKLFVGASNEWPGEDGGKELGALFDRFLIRKTVRPITELANRKRLLFGARDHSPQFRETLDLHELRMAQNEVLDLDWTKDAEDGMVSIIGQCNQEGIMPGDRRQFKSVKVCQAYAFLNGRDEVTVADLSILAHTLWEDPSPEQVETVERIVLRAADAVGWEIKKQMDVMEDICKKTADPKEVVAKLQDIGQTINTLGSHPRKALAQSVIKNNISVAYKRIINV